jgi:predicted transcriptional regulator of viral defense system
MNSKSVSKRESQVIQEIKHREMIFFDPGDISRFLDIKKRNAYNLLSRMEEKDLIHRVQSGKYALTETMNSKDIYELASNIVKPSYLGFFSALHFHGLTDQVPQKVQVASTKRKKAVKLQGRKVEFIKIKTRDYYGYKNYNGVISSDPEKTVIDSLRLPDKAGDFSNLIDLDFSELNPEKLVRYCRRTDSSTIASRIGFLLDQNSINFDEKPLKSMLSHYSKLDPTKKQENPVEKWKIYANREIK